MKKVPFTNNTKNIKHIGTCTIWPGQTREVEETLHPDYKSAPAEEVVIDPNADLKLLLEGNVNSVRDALPGLADQELDSLELIESDESGGKNRSGVTAAITEARLQRAKDADLETFKESLVGLDSDGLTEKLDEINGDLDRQALIDAAIEALPEGNG